MVWCVTLCGVLWCVVCVRFYVVCCVVVCYVVCGVVCCGVEGKDETKGIRCVKRVC